MNHSHQERGFSLIEFMVALTISLLALLAVSELYLNSRQSSRLQQMQNVLTEEGRFAVSMLQRTISQTGFHPVASAAFSTPLSSATASSVAISFAQNNHSIVDCNGSATGSGTLTLTLAASGNTLGCTPASGTTVNWIDASTSAQGVELMDFKLEYGIDNGPESIQGLGCGTTTASGTQPSDCIPDSYVSTLNASTTLSQIRAVKACLVLRTTMTDTLVRKSQPVNNCSGVAIANSQNDQRLYRQFRTTILFKNQ